MSPKPIFFSRYNVGLSEVVAAVILTLASLVALAAAYAVGMLKIAPASSSASLMVSAHLEPFGTGGLLEVTVYNVGKEPVTLTQVRLLSGSNTLWSININHNLKPSTGWSNTYVVSGVASGGVYVVEARANTQRSPPTTIIGSVGVSMR